MYDGFEEGAATFRFSDCKACQEQEKTLVRPYDGHESSKEQLANGDIDEENMPIVLNDLFKEGGFKRRTVLGCTARTC